MTGPDLPEWFDSHCHLQDEFEDHPADPAAAPAGPPPSDGAHATRRHAAVARAAEAGVTRLVVVGTGAATSAAAVALVRDLRQPGGVGAGEGVEGWATVGLHPHDATEGVDSLDPVLRDGAADGADDHPGGRIVVAIGECGLDYHYEHSPRDVQRRAFAEQIALAHRLDLALVVHTRDAWDDTVDVLRAEGVPDRTVIHCFTGGPTEARRCLDLGAYLSFSGVVTFKNAGEVREAAALCPVDRLLVETDSPFLAPVPHRGSVNEPSRVPLVGATVAAVQGRPVVEVAAAATATARAVFRV